jgi:GntR family transcriptional regulator
MHAIETGALVPGDQLPAIRTLAESLIVSPNTVVKAYGELEQEGVVRTRQGAGAYVEDTGATRSRQRKFRDAAALMGETVRKLRAMGLSDDESRRLFEASLSHKVTSR